MYMQLDKVVEIFLMKFCLKVYVFIGLRWMKISFKEVVKFMFVFDYELLIIFICIENIFVVMRNDFKRI